MMPVPDRILVALEPVDFRKQIDGLASVCESRLGEEPLDGTLFLFRNRRCTSLKGLMWTSGGFTMAYKKLEQGRFTWPCGDGDKVRMTRAEVAALLEGLDVSNARRLSRWNPANQHDNTPEPR
ncbi:MAG: IS66 family insertion sequence element accessory protein TnpB [bacterium]|nr:IS66 family insertion sequence element accessory protein TnpB [bacterium]